jgi:hypothetical protein
MLCELCEDMLFNANVSSLVPLPYIPTAVQAADVMHDALSRREYVELVGVGLDAIDQVVPSQDSMRALSPVLSTVNPTDAQTLVAKHETPVRTSCWESIGLGLEMMDQFIPSQVSTRVSPPDEPTAVHELGETHEMLLNAASESIGLGLETWVQLVPSQFSTRVLRKFLPKIQPTAVQALDAVHETLLSVPVPL